MSDSGSMPTSEQGVLHNQAGLEESVLACFLGSMDNNWQFGIIIMGSSILLWDPGTKNHLTVKSELN